MAQPPASSSSRQPDISPRPGPSAGPVAADIGRLTEPEASRATWNPVFDAEGDSAPGASSPADAPAVFLDEVPDIEQEVREKLQLAVSREAVFQLKEFRRLSQAADPDSFSELMSAIDRLDAADPVFPPELPDELEDALILAPLPGAEAEQQVEVTALGRTALSLLEQAAGLDPSYHPGFEQALRWVEAVVASGNRVPHERQRALAEAEVLHRRTQLDYLEFASSTAWSTNDPAEPDLLPESAGQVARFTGDHRMSDLLGGGSALDRPALVDAWLSTAREGLARELVRVGPEQVREVLSLSGHEVAFELDRTGMRIAALAEDLRLAQEGAQAWEAQIAGLPRVDDMYVFAYVDAERREHLTVHDVRFVADQLRDAEADFRQLRLDHKDLVRRFTARPRHPFPPTREEIRAVRSQAERARDTRDRLQAELNVLQAQLELLGKNPRYLEMDIRGEFRPGYVSELTRLWQASGEAQSLQAVLAEALAALRAASESPTAAAWADASARLAQLHESMRQLTASLRGQEQQLVRELARARTLRDKSLDLHQAGTGHHGLFHFRAELAELRRFQAAARYHQVMDE
ncbi:MAG: hypothetical protein ACRC0L_00765, partial [Angustibacter sp.]